MSKNHEDGIYYGQAGFIETSTGGKFSVEAPVFNIEDIAHGLSMCCRYNGQCKAFYSVAEHCILVDYLMENHVGGNPFEGLMHDALEAYLSDVPAPLKQFLPDYKALDAKLDHALREQFNLEPEKSEECREADWLALFIEAYYIMPSQGELFADPNNLRPKALEILNKDKLVLACMPPAVAKQLWLRVFDESTGGLLSVGGTPN